MKTKPDSLSPSTGLQAGQHGGQGLWGQLGAFGLVLVWGQTTHNGWTAPLQECHTCLDKRFLTQHRILVKYNILKGSMFQTQ